MEARKKLMDHGYFQIPNYINAKKISSLLLYVYSVIEIFMEVLWYSLKWFIDIGAKGGRKPQMTEIIVFISRNIYT